MHDGRMDGAVGRNPVGDEIVLVGSPGAGDAFKMRRNSAGMIVSLVGTRRPVVDIAVLRAEPATRQGHRIATGDLVAIDAISGGAGGAGNVVRRVGRGVDVVDEGVAGRQTGVIVANDRVAERAVRDGIERIPAGIGQRRDAALRAARAVIEIAEVVGRRRFGLIGADDAQDPAGVAEARSIGRRADRAGKVGAIGRREGHRRPGAARKIVIEPAGLRGAGYGVIADDIVAADASEEGALRTIVERLELEFGSCFCGGRIPDGE